MVSQEQLMKTSYMAGDGLSLGDSVWEFLVSARLELFAFCSAMIMYSILFMVRAPKDKTLQKVGKASLPGQGPKQVSTQKDGCSTKTARDASTSKPDAAKHIVMIRKCANENNLKGAMGVFEALESSGAELNSIAYNTVLDACVKCRDLKAAESWMERMRDAQMIDVVSFNTILKAHLMNGDVKKARSVVRDMKSAGFQPNRVTYNELVNAVVARSGSNHEIWDVVTEMREMGVPPNQVTCSILLKNLNARSPENEVKATMDLIGSIDEPMDDVLMSSVVEACVRVGKPDLLADKLKQLQANSRIPVTSSHTFGSLIKAYGHAQDIDGVWRCWKEMRSQLIKPSSITMGCMVEAIVNNGCTEDAYELIQQLQADPQCRDVVNAITYCSLLKGFSREKKLNRVWTIYEEMEERNVELSLVAFNTVLDACARVGRMDHVPRIKEAMKKHAVEANIITYSTLVKGHSQAGNIELAFNVIHEMKQETKLKPDEIMYNTMLDGCAQSSLYEEGIRLFDEMVREGVAPSNFTLSILVKLFSRSRKVDQAFATVKDMSQKYGIKPNVHVYTNLIQSCVSNRKYNARAVTVLDTMMQERVKPDCRTYGILIRASIYQNQFEQAAGLLRGAMGLPGALAILQDARFAACSPLDERMVNQSLTSLAEHGCGESLVEPILADVAKSKCKVRIDPAVRRLIGSA